jgi:hypothetical protein
MYLKIIKAKYNSTVIKPTTKTYLTGWLNHAKSSNKDVKNITKNATKTIAIILKLPIYNLRF